MRNWAIAYFLPFAVGVVATVGCGGDSTRHGERAAESGTSGAAATGQAGTTVPRGASGQGGAASGPDPAGAAATSAAGGAAPTCPVTMVAGQPISEVPREVGCYAGIDGVWHAVPCECDLWVDSTFSSELRVGFSLSFTPANLAPSLDGDVDVELEFPDPAANWFDTWQRQAELTMSFAVAHSSQDGTTTVRLGQSEVVLEPVPLAACESRRPRASVRGPWGTTLQLDMVATLTDASGRAVATINNDCAQFASHPTPHEEGAGAAGSPP